MVATRLMTAEELLSLPEDEARFELLEGDRLPMSPVGARHIRVASRLHEELVLWARAQQFGAVWGGDAGITFGRDPDTVLSPDISVVSGEQLSRIAPDERGFPEVIPTLVVEVKSSSDREAEIARKLGIYLNAGVRVVWWVRPEARTVSVHRPDAAPEVVDGAGALACEDVLPGFGMRVADLFA